MLADTPKHSSVDNVRRALSALVLCTALLLAPGRLSAQTRSDNLVPVLDPRGEAELTICSQNLANYGALKDVKLRAPGMSEYDLRSKGRALISRFVSKQCDLIAVQELLGKEEAGALLVLDQLAQLLRRATNRIFEVKTGPSNDPMSRVGFLVAKDRAEVLNVVSYNNIELPKLSEKQKPRDFPRGPLEIQISVKPRGEGHSRAVTLVNIHFKSKRGAAEDPAQLEWETHRMEMAEAIRRILDSRYKKAFFKADPILVVLGDRNSNFDVASAKILDSTLRLKDFQENAPCRLSKRGVPLCQAGIAKPPKLFSVLLGDPQTKLMHGTFVFEKEYSWLDEILMPAEALRFAWRKADTAGDYESGVVNEFPEASDHSMVWTRLNW